MYAEVGYQKNEPGSTGIVKNRGALCLHFAYYNFCRIHRSLRVTPAMESGITDRVWTIAELVRD